jgi:hypothetical protein
MTPAEIRLKTTTAHIIERITPEPSMTTTTIEARTIRNLAELRDYLDACISAAGVKPQWAEVIHLGTPVDMRLTETVLTDGSKVYDLDVVRW